MSPSVHCGTVRHEVRQDPSRAYQGTFDMSLLLLSVSVLQYKLSLPTDIAVHHLSMNSVT